MFAACLKLLSPCAVLLILPALPFSAAPLPAHSVNPAASVANPVPGLAATLQICRVDVTPCQREVNLPVDGEVVLDLFLTPAAGWNPPEAHFLVAWETHFQLTGDAEVKLVKVGPAGAPVQEQGSSRLVLDGLARLSRNSGTAAVPAGRYYRVQNRYDQTTGRLDFSVTLAGFSPDNPPTDLMALTPETRLLLGVITIRGATPGRAELTAANSAGRPFQIVTITGAGKATPRPVDTGQPLVVVNVGPAAEQARLRGQVWAQSPAGEEKSHPFGRQFTLTFWQEGAVPPWRGGEAAPVVAFTSLTADRRAGFIVKDLPRELIPPGVYDLRVKGVGALSRRVPGVTVDLSGAAPDNRPVIVSVDFGALPYGDINGDNGVDRADLSAFKPGFGQTGKGGAFNPAADFNGDKVVDSQDFSLLAANFNRMGE